MPKSARSQQLDDMSEEDKKHDLLKNLRKRGAVVFDTHQAEAFWGDAANALVDDKLVVLEFISSETDQYSCCWMRWRCRVCAKAVPQKAHDDFPITVCSPNCLAVEVTQRALGG